MNTTSIDPITSRHGQRPKLETNRGVSMPCWGSWKAKMASRSAVKSWATMQLGCELSKWLRPPPKRRPHNGWASSIQACTPNIVVSRPSFEFHPSCGINTCCCCSYSSSPPTTTTTANTGLSVLHGVAKVVILVCSCCCYCSTTIAVGTNVRATTFVKKTHKKIRSPKTPAPTDRLQLWGYKNPPTRA